jgi:cytoskeletal protein CcmA (bactofilin family)
MSRSARLWVLSACVAGLFGAAQARAADADMSSVRFGSDEFAVGRNVRVLQPISGDGFLAAHEIEVSSSVGGDLAAAATELRLSGQVGHNLYAAARRIELEGTVDGNARLAAADLHVAPAARIGGGSTLAAERIEFEGQALGYLTAAARSVSIDGHVGGDATVTAADLEIGPQAVIDGSLVFRGPRAPNVATGARIHGGVQFIEQHQRRVATPALFRVGAWLWLVGWMIAGAVIIAIWPTFTRAITGETARHHLYAALMGLAVLVVTPVAITLLVVTVIGIPLALLLLALYLMVLPLGYLAGAASIGDAVAARAPALTGAAGRRALALAIALLALFLVKHVPFIGPLIIFLVLIAGMGGILLASHRWHGTSNTPAPGAGV